MTLYPSFCIPGCYSILFREGVHKFEMWLRRDAHIIRRLNLIFTNWNGIVWLLGALHGGIFRLIGFMSLQLCNFWVVPLQFTYSEQCHYISLKPWNMLFSTSSTISDPHAGIDITVKIKMPLLWSYLFTHRHPTSRAIPFLRPSFSPPMLFIWRQWLLTWCIARSHPDAPLLHDGHGSQIKKSREERTEERDDMWGQMSVSVERWS